MADSLRNDVDVFIAAVGEIFKDNFWGFEELKLSKTCSALPEQYSVYIDGELAGYLRLRHGEFLVDYPKSGAETIYESEAMNGDGLFDPEERGKFIGEAIAACVNKWTADRIQARESARVQAMREE